MRRRPIAIVLLGALGASVIAAVAGAGAAAVPRPSPCPSAVVGKTDLGRLAFVAGDQLRIVRLASCQVRTLVGAGVQPPVRWSADGRYLAYGSGEVVSAGGGTSSSPLGRLEPGWSSASPGWVWSPTGHRLAGVTAGGGVVLGGPNEKAVRLRPQNWGATSIAWSPDGHRLAVSRSLYPKAPAPYHQEVWLLNLQSGERTVLWRLAKPNLGPPWLSGFSPDGSWLLMWEDSQNSASLAADGVPLALIPTTGGKSITLGGELMYGDFVSWCGADTLAYVRDDGGRQVSMGDRISIAGPPDWSATTPADSGAAKRLSYISPICGAVGGKMMTIAAAGASSPDLPFGHERRSIWEIVQGGNWTPLETPPPPGWSDELPLLSHDHRWVAFIRTDEKDSGSSGSLYLLELGKRFDGHARRIGPLVDPSGAGGRFGNNYYGHYGWAGELAWYSS
jgi:hypothetical protein